MMEAAETYLDRKNDELELLNGCLSKPLALRRPASVADVIEQKFRLAAALKAEHAQRDWAFTETGWAHSGRPHAGPFEFNYDYQRADLDVRGPSFYAPHDSDVAYEAVYTASGMAAISALLLASVRMIPEADVIVLPRSYSETLELIENHVRQFRLIRLNRSPARSPAASAGLAFSFWIHVHPPLRSRRLSTGSYRAWTWSFSILPASAVAPDESEGF